MFLWLVKAVEDRDRVQVQTINGDLDLGAKLRTFYTARLPYGVSEVP